MDKKGVLGLDTVARVMILFLVIGVIAVTIILTMVTLQDQDASIMDFSLHIENESVGTGLINSSYTYFFPGNAFGDRCRITNLLAYNNTAPNTVKQVVTANNYTINATACGIILIPGPVTAFNDSAMNFSYDIAYRTNTTKDIGQNVSIGVASFFSSTGTIFAILVVVVIILAIAIIIAVVSRFGGGVGGRRRESGGKGGAEASTVMGV